MRSRKSIIIQLVLVAHVFCLFVFCHETGNIKVNSNNNIRTLTISVITLGSVLLDAPKNPFLTVVNLGTFFRLDLIKAIGMETVTTAAAAAPIGPVALGALALGARILWRLWRSPGGTVG